MIRRVVTGHDNGKSVVVHDGTPARTHVFEHAKGMAYSMAWATPSDARLSAASKPESVDASTTVIPGRGETRLLFLQVPPDSYATSKDFDPMAAVGEIVAHQPDIAATMEPDAPGMHRTDSIDYVIVLSGEVHLELDDEEEVRLTQHDVVVQGGGRHAWRNKTSEPVVLAVVLVGADRDV